MVNIYFLVFIQRFGTAARVMHIFVIIGLMGPGLTGMMLKFARMAVFLGVGVIGLSGLIL